VAEKDGQSQLFDTYPDLLTIKNLQEALGISRTIAYNLIKDEQIHHLRIGKSIHIPKRFLLDYVEQSCYNGYVTASQPS